MSTTNEQLEWSAANAVKHAERSISNPNNFDADRSRSAYTAAEDALAALVAAQADHPSAAGLRERLAAIPGKLDEIEVGQVKEGWDAQKRQADMTIRSFEDSAQRGGGDPGDAAYRLQGFAARARELLESRRDRLGSERGKAAAA